MIHGRNYTIKFNRRKKTYTIRVYENGVLISKYRSFPQGCEYSENFSESDIYSFLRYSSEYYIVK